MVHKVIAIVDAPHPTRVVDILPEPGNPAGPYVSQENNASIYATSRYPYTTLYIYQCNHSPYMFGLSARMYPSNERFMTVAQLRSISSSISSRTVSPGPSPPPTPSFSLSVEEARWASRSALSPLMNLVPRSGKFRDGSNGSHLLILALKKYKGPGGVPEIMEMV